MVISQPVYTGYILKRSATVPIKITRYFKTKASMTSNLIAMRSFIQTFLTFLLIYFKVKTIVFIIDKALVLIIVKIESILEF